MKAKYSKAASPKLFTFQTAAITGFSCYNVMPPPPRTIALYPCLPLYIKDLVKEDVVDWLAAVGLAVCKVWLLQMLLCVCECKDRDFKE
jgi:hypothetical protein